MPPKQEGPGAIPSDSLAAESIRSGGAFSENPGASVGRESGSQKKANAPGSAHQSHPTSQPKHENSEQGRPAPTYVNVAMDHSDKSGPHGKNIKEGGFAGSGTEGGMAEPGTKRDPGRVALQDMLTKGTGSAPGVTKETKPTETGPKGYEALGGDTEA